MRYGTAGAFRRALEDRLRAQSQASSLPLVRLRKMVAFERFLARLVQAHPDAWILKGGLALQFRIGDRARTTQDLDLLLQRDIQDAHALLRQAAILDLRDWFDFEVGSPKRDSAVLFEGGLRFPVQALLDGRPFERFHVDIGSGDPVLESSESLLPPSLLAFAEIQSSAIPCYPVTQQIAEKVHALTRPHLGRESTRAKDLVDILLLASLRSLDGQPLLNALKATFEGRGTHEMPASLPDLPANWSPTVHRLSADLGLPWKTLEDASRAAHSFIDPILQVDSRELWDPMEWRWS